MECKIVVSVSCYNNEDEILRFAEMLSKQTLKNRIVLTVTYNSGTEYNKLVNQIKRIDISSQVFNPGKNLGYLSGACYGASRVHRDQNTWIVICNTDIEFCGNNFFEALFRNVPSKAWVVAPMIKLLSTSAHQNPFFEQRPSAKYIKMRSAIYSNLVLFDMFFLLSSVKTKLSKNKHNTVFKSRNVYAVHGSFFAININLFNEILGTKDNIFMYGEELLVAELTRKGDGLCYLNCDAMLIHNENQVTSLLSNKRKQAWFKQSTDYLLNSFWTEN